MADKRLDFIVRLKDEATKTLNKMKGSLGGLKSVMSSPAFAAFGTFFGAAGAVRVAGSMLRVMGDFEESMNKVGAISRANAQEMKALEDAARQLGATTRFSASEVAEGMSFMAMAGFEVNDIVGAMPNVLNLATAAQVDMATAADISSNILTGYRLEVEDLSRANDVLVQAFTSANVDLRMLGESMKYVGPVASGLKVDFEETVAAISLMGQAGIQGSMSGTALRGALTRLASPTDKEAQLMKILNLEMIKNEDGGISLTKVVQGLEKTMADGTSETEVAAMAMELFGDRAGPGLMALLSQGSAALVKMLGELKNAEGITDETADRMNKGLNAQLKALNSAWEEFALTIGDTGILTRATSGLAMVTDALRGVTEIVKEEGFWAGIGQSIAGAVIEWTRFIVELFLGIPDVVADVLAKIFGEDFIAPARENWQIIKNIVGGFFDFLTDLVSGNAATWDTLIAGITAAWEFVRSAAIMAWSQIMRFILIVWDAISAAVDSTVGAIVGTWQETAAFFTGLWSSVVNFFVGLWVGVVNFLGSVWGAIRGSATAAALFVIGAWNSFVIWLFTTFPQIPQIIETVSQIIQDIWARLIMLLVEGVAFLLEAWDAAREYISEVVANIVDTVLDYWSGLVAASESILAGIAAIFTAIWAAIEPSVEAVIDFIVELWEALVTTLEGVFNSIQEVAVAVWNDIAAAIEGPLATIQEFVLFTYQNLTDSTTSFVDGLKAKFDAAFTAIRDKVSQMSASMYQVFKDALDKMKEWADKILDAILDKVRWVADLVAIHSIWPEMGQVMIDVLKGVYDYSNAATPAWANRMVSVHSQAAIAIEDIWKGVDANLSTAGMFGGILPDPTMEKETGKGKDKTIELVPDQAALKIWSIYQKNMQETLTLHELTVVRENDLFNKQIQTFKDFATERQVDSATLNQWIQDATNAHNLRMAELEVAELERRRELWAEAYTDLLTQNELDIMAEEERYQAQLDAFNEYATIMNLSEAEQFAFQEEAARLHEENMWLIQQDERSRQIQRIQDTSLMWAKILDISTEAAQMMYDTYMQMGTGIADIFADTLGSIWAGAKQGKNAIEQALGELLGAIASQYGDLLLEKGFADIAYGTAQLFLGDPKGGGLIAAGGLEVTAGIGLKALGSALGQAGGGSSGGGGGGGYGGGGSFSGGFDGDFDFGYGGDGIAGRDSQDLAGQRGGRVNIDLSGLTEDQIVTDIPGFIETIITEINRGAQRDLDINFTGEAE